jgi:hypothetical protein
LGWTGFEGTACSAMLSEARQQTASVYRSFTVPEVSTFAIAIVPRHAATRGI